MSGRDLEVDVFVFLQSIQLEQFYHKINDELHLTRLSHFDHVTESDLEDINMSKPEQRRLFDAVKKYKKEKKKGHKIRISFRVSFTFHAYFNLLYYRKLNVITAMINFISLTNFFQNFGHS